MSREEVVDALIAERYAKPTWWKTPPRDAPPRPIATPDFDNSEVAQAQRRRALAADFKEFERSSVDKLGTA